MLVDQTRAQAEAEDKKKQELLMAKLTRDSEQERSLAPLHPVIPRMTHLTVSSVCFVAFPCFSRRVGEELWRARLYKDVIRQNRTVREIQYAEQRRNQDRYVSVSCLRLFVFAYQRLCYCSEALERDRSHFDSMQKANAEQVLPLPLLFAVVD